MHKTKEKRKKQWLNESKSKGKQINWKKLKAWLNVQWNLMNLSLKEFEKGEEREVQVKVICLKYKCAWHLNQKAM